MSTSKQKLQPALAPSPQTLRDHRVDRVRPHAVVALGLDQRDVAVLAVHAAVAFELLAGRAPDRRRGTLLDCLEAADPTCALDHDLQLLGIVVAREIGLEDRAGVHRERADAIALVATIDLDGEQYVRGLRLPVRDHLVVRTMFAIPVLDVARGTPVSARSQRDDASA